MNGVRFMKTKAIADMCLVTTISPVSSGRKSEFYPVLVVRPDRYDSIESVLSKYPGCVIREPLGRHLHPISDVLEVVSASNKKLARYRYIEEYGWLEEVSPNWTVNGDYATSLAASFVSRLPNQGLLNVATAMRFGVLLVAYLLGEDQEHVRHLLVSIVGEILTRNYRDDCIRIEGGRIILSI
jgi:hypothetical protein